MVEAKLEMKRLVEVAFVVVLFVAVKFWRVVDPLMTNPPELVAFWNEKFWRVVEPMARKLVV